MKNLPIRCSWYNFGAVVADEQNMETYIRHKGICCNNGNRNVQFILPVTKIWTKWWHHFPKMNSAADDNCLTQFSAMGIGTEISWNWRCCHCFSFSTWYQHVLCFWFHILPTWVNADVCQQCNYKCIIMAIPNLISGIMFSVRCLENMDPFAKVHVSVWCGDWFGFKIVIIIHQKSMNAKFHSRHYWL